MLKTPVSRRLTGALLATGALIASIAITAPALANPDETAPEESVSEEPVTEMAPETVDDAPAPDDAAQSDAPVPAEADQASSSDTPAADAPQAPSNATAETPAEAAPAAASAGTYAKGGKDDGEIPGVQLDKRNADYYDRRAEELLKEDAAITDQKQHPLASAYPNQFVVVCEAGCAGRTGAEIVGLTPRPAPKPVQAPAASSGTTDLISCLGGCGEGPGNYVGAPRAVTAMAAASVGEWMTTVARVPEGSPAPKPGSAASSGSGSGDWMKRINADRGAPAEAPTTKQAAAVEAKPAAKVETKVPVVVDIAPAKPTVTIIAKAPDASEAVAEVAPAPESAAKAQDLADAMATTPPVAAPAADMSAKPAVPPPAPSDAAEPAAAASEAAEPTASKPVEMAALDTTEAAKAVEPQKAEPAKSEDKVISVLSEDKEMNAAIEKSRASLASFWQSFEKPATGETDFALKVAISGNGATEHFWLTEIRREGDKITGLISNEPQRVKTVRLGQPYTFTEAEISDWTFKRNGKLVGNETMRVLLPRMPKEQASVYRQMYETP